MSEYIVEEDLKYTKEHEWVSIDGDIATVGITDYAQKSLGDLVYVELPEIGSSFNKGDMCVVVESFKAASDVYSPLSGAIEEVNSDLTNAPDIVNSEPYNNGWLFKIKLSDAGEADDLMQSDDYHSYINDLEQE